VDDIRVFSGYLVADLVLTHARTIKERRKPLQALLQRLRNQQYNVAQVGPTDRMQRAFIAVAAVSGSESRLTELLAGAERIIFASDFEVAELHRDVTVFSKPAG